MTEDNAQNPSGEGDASAEQAEISKRCWELEDAWRTGEPPRLEDFLHGVTGGHRARLLQTLVEIDVEHRRRRNLSVSPEAYGALADEVAGFLSRVSDPPAGSAEVVTVDHWAISSGTPQGSSAPIESPERLPDPIGPYRFLGLLGVGGFGAVWRAVDEQLGREVAIKLPRRGSLSDHERERLQREAEASAQLDHPGIVPLISFGEAEGQLYLVSRLVPGMNLKEWLEDEQLTNREAADFALQVAEALAYAHGRGIIHRDVKPGNLLVDAERRLYLTDFGMAKWVDGDSSMTQSAMVMGTPAYLAPEQADGRSREADQRTDVYAFGALLYEMLAGSAPFRGDTTAVIHQVCQVDPVRPTQLKSTVSRDLETIALKCLEKSPERRYQSAGEVVAELRRYLAGKPIKARPVGVVGRTLKLCRRNPVASAAGAVAVLALVVATGVSSAYAVRAAAARDQATESRDEAESARMKAEASARRSQHLLYLAHMQRAQKEWDDSNVKEASRLLRIYHPTESVADFRNWEWFYLWRLCHQQCRAIHEHGGWVRSVAISPDGRRLASAGSKSGIKIWGPNGKVLQELRAKAVRAIDTSPDSRMLASAGDGNGITLWNMDTGKRVGEFLEAGGREESRRYTQCIAFDPSGSKIASAGRDKSIRLWSVANGELITKLRGHASIVNDLSFSSDGKLLVSAGYDDTVRLWSLGGESLAETLRANAGGVLAAAVDRTGDTVAFGGHDRAVKLWKAGRGDLVRTLGFHRGAVRALEFSPDGKILASASADKTVVLWDPIAGVQIRALRGHSDCVFDLAFNSDGTSVCTSSADGEVRVWDLGTPGESEVYVGHGERVMWVAAHPSRSEVASASFDKTIKIWDLRTDGPKKTLEGHSAKVLAASYAKDGSRLVSADSSGEVIVWDLVSGEPSDRFKFGWQVTCVAFNPSGDEIACNLPKGVVLLDINSRTERVLQHNGKRNGLFFAYSPDGALIASADASGEVLLWDSCDGRLLRTFPGSSKILGITFSPDGKIIASACLDSIVRIWDVESGVEQSKLRGHLQPLTSLCFSPDGSRLVASDEDEVIRIWDVSTSEQVCTLSVDSGYVQSVTFTADSKSIVAGTVTSKLVVWRTQFSDAGR